MQIDIIPEHLLRKEDESQIIDLLARAFDTDFGGRSYYLQRHHLRLVLRDPNIVGHMAIQFRAIAQDNQHITIAGLAEVSTDPGRRGEGIASALLVRAIDEAKASIAEHFLLFGDAPIYAGHGFRAVQNRLTFVGLGADNKPCIVEGDSDGLMVLELGSKPWDGLAPIDLIGRKF